LLLQQKFNRFLWAGTDQNRAKVSWERVCVFLNLKVVG